MIVKIVNLALPGFVPWDKIGTFLSIINAITLRGQFVGRNFVCYLHFQSWNLVRLEQCDSVMEC